VAIGEGYRRCAGMAARSTGKYSPAALPRIAGLVWTQQSEDARMSPAA